MRNSWLHPACGMTKEWMASWRRAEAGGGGGNRRQPCAWLAVGWDVGPLCDGFLTPLLGLSFLLCAQGDRPAWTPAMAPLLLGFPWGLGGVPWQRRPPGLLPVGRCRIAPPSPPQPCRSWIAFLLLSLRALHGPYWLPAILSVTLNISHLESVIHFHTETQ